MKEIKVTRYSVRKLWSLCQQGIFAIPEIQREFVWDTRRVANLLDSIYRQLPIGSLLIWETTSDRQHLLRHSQETLPPHDLKSPKIWFIIDGQQRLGVLYRAKMGGKIVNSNDKEIDFNKLCISFDSRHTSKFAFVRRPLPRSDIPFADIFDSGRAYRFRNLPEVKRKDITKCRERIASYQVPVIIVHTNDREEVREAFLRINSGGLRISKADRGFMLAYRLDLRRLVKELRERLPNGFNRVAIDTLQSAIALIEREKEISIKAVESAINRVDKRVVDSQGRVTREFTRYWKEVRVSIQKAVDYLCNEIGVPNLSFLPSENILPVLSFFFHSNNGAQPTSIQRREIRKWFWTTGVARRYAGRGFYQNIRNDLTFFQRLAKQRQTHFTFRELVPASDLKHTDYSVRSGLSTAFFLLLTLRQPLYLESGNRIPLDKTASIANRKDKHHIFPKALLTRNGFTTREANNLCNICYIVAEENQYIGSNRPTMYLSFYKNNGHFARVMKSHLIPYKRESGLWSRNIRRGFKQFENQRLQVLLKAFEKEAGIKLFRRD